ncbi:hypothetical protein CCP4SC76_2160014 [Gammaproteobacteria bacterium]
MLTKSYPQVLTADALLTQFADDILYIFYIFIPLVNSVSRVYKELYQNRQIRQIRQNGMVRIDSLISLFEKSLGNRPGSAANRIFLRSDMTSKHTTTCPRHWAEHQDKI